MKLVIIFKIVLYSLLCVKLTTHLHLVLWSRMHGIVPPLPQYAFMEWCLVKKEHRDTFTFTFEVYYAEICNQLHCFNLNKAHLCLVPNIFILFMTVSEQCDTFKIFLTWSAVLFPSWPVLQWTVSWLNGL